jgi:hypothetical protein
VPVLAIDAFVYPPGSTVGFTCSVILDTVTVTLENSGPLPVSDIYVAEHTIYPPHLVTCRVDGSPYLGLVMEADSVFSGVRTTRWIVGQFQSKLELVYYVPSYFNSHLNWVAFQEGPVFGLVTDPNCCAGKTGNVDNDLTSRADLTDLSMLLGFLTGSPYKLNCPAEANINSDPYGAIDLSDLALLIGHLILRQTLPTCP